MRRTFGWILMGMALCPLAGTLLAGADTLSLPGDLTEVQDEAFYKDSSLDEVLLPEGALRIGERAFASSGVRQVTLPDSLTHIAESAFDQTRLAKVMVHKGTYAYDWAVAHGYQQAIVTGDEIDPLSYGLPTPAPQKGGSWETSGDNRQFRKANGKLANVEVLNIGGKLYVFSSWSNMVKDRWYEVGEVAYLAGPKGPLITNSWVTNDDYSAISHNGVDTNDVKLSNFYQYNQEVWVNASGQFEPRVSHMDWDQILVVGEDIREREYNVTPVSGKKAYYQWIKKTGNSMGDMRVITPLKKRTPIKFGIGDADNPWVFYGKNCIIEGFNG